MVDGSTDFLHLVNNFAKIGKVRSFLVYESGNVRDLHPLVTIAIPTFRRPRLLMEALTSAAMQKNFADYEILVVDNDPTEDIDKEVYHFLERLPSKNVRYYRNESNIGMYGNWNRCIELARGEWITLLHDDDMLSEDIVHEFNSYRQQMNSDFFAFACAVRDERKNLLIRSAKRNESLMKLLPSRLWRGNIFLGTLGIFFKKKIAIQLGGFNDEYFPISDLVFFYNYAACSGKSYLSSKVLATYRISTNESLNASTLEESVRSLYYFKMNVLGKMSMLKPFFRSANRVFMKEMIDSYRKFLDDSQIAKLQRELDIPIPTRVDFASAILIRAIQKAIGLVLWRLN